MDYAQYPEMGRMIVATSRMFVSEKEDAAAVLQGRPVTFAAVALAEVLGRWQFRGVPCSEVRIPCKPEEEKAKGLTAR